MAPAPTGLASPARWSSRARATAWWCGSWTGSAARCRTYSASSPALRERGVAFRSLSALARPPDDPYFDELVAQHSRVRRFLPGLARVAQLGAAPAAKPLLAALHHLRKGDSSPAKLPVEFVPPGWLGRVVRDGAVDPKAWTLCVVDRMRAALRRRDLFASPSLRYADPRAGLLDGAAWESARTAVCRSLGVSASGPEEVARMAGRSDAAYRATAARLPGNASVRIETAADGTAALSLSALDKLDEPASLVAHGRHQDVNHPVRGDPGYAPPLIVRIVPVRVAPIAGWPGTRPRRRSPRVPPPGRTASGASTRATVRHRRAPVPPAPASAFPSAPSPPGRD